MEDNLPFRSAAFGGFNREDVVEYIKNAADESAAQINQLRQKLEELTEENRQNAEARAQLQAQLDAQEASVNENLDAVESQLGEFVQQQQVMKEELSRKDSEHAAELDRCKEEFQNIMKQEQERAKQQIDQAVSRYQVNAESYDRLKNSIGEIELQARLRAQGILDKAQQQAEEIVKKAERDYLEEKKKAEEKMAGLRDTYTATAKDVNTSVNAALRQTEEMQDALQQLAAAFSASSQLFSGQVAGEGAVLGVVSNG